MTTDIFDGLRLSHRSLCVLDIVDRERLLHARSNHTLHRQTRPFSAKSRNSQNRGTNCPRTLLLLIFWCVFVLLLIDITLKRGQNKTPVVAIILVACVTFIFILVGQINILAPIVSMPFMLTYAAVNYAFFALETTTAAAAKTGVFKKPNEDKKPPTPDQKDSHKQALSDDIYDRDEPNSDSKFALSFLSNRWLSFMGVSDSQKHFKVVFLFSHSSSFIVQGRAVDLVDDRGQLRVRVELVCRLLRHLLAAAHLPTGLAARSFQNRRQPEDLKRLLKVRESISTFFILMTNKQTINPNVFDSKIKELLYSGRLKVQGCGEKSREPSALGIVRIRYHANKRVRRQRERVAGHLSEHGLHEQATLSPFRARKHDKMSFGLHACILFCII